MESQEAVTCKQTKYRYRGVHVHGKKDCWLTPGSTVLSLATRPGSTVADWPEWMHCTHASSSHLHSPTSQINEHTSGSSGDRNAQNAKQSKADPASRPPKKRKTKEREREREMLSLPSIDPQLSCIRMSCASHRTQPSLHSLSLQCITEIDADGFDSSG